MSDTFIEPTPVEVHQAILQFMGQNMSEFKKLDENIISRTNTLQGMTLQPRQVLNTIPVPQQPQIQPAPQYIPPPPPMTQQVNIPAIPVESPRDPNDPVQLEFSFDNSPYSKTIFVSLTDIQKVLNEYAFEFKKINEKLDIIINNTTRTDIKKKVDTES